VLAGERPARGDLRERPLSVSPRSTANKISVSSAASGSLLGGNTTPYLWQLKFLGSYLLPYDVQVAATYQTLPAHAERERHVFKCGGPALVGAALSQTTSVLVNVIEPGAVYADRLHQLDLRATKI